MAVNSLTSLLLDVLPNKKDEEEILSPSLGLSLDLNIKFKMFILPPPKIKYKKSTYFVDAKILEVLYHRRQIH